MESPVHTLICTLHVEEEEMHVFSLICNQRQFLPDMMNYNYGLWNMADNFVEQTEVDDMKI